MFKILAGRHQTRGRLRDRCDRLDAQVGSDMDELALGQHAPAALTAEPAAGGRWAAFSERRELQTSGPAPGSASRP